MADAHDADLPTGRIGRYELVRRMASGGMGELYLAHDPDVDRPIVIKLLQDRIDSPLARQRFAIEGRAAGRLRHKNIVTVFDVGEWQSRSWIAMEFITGETLAQKIERKAPLPLASRLRYIEELCSGLDFAHRNGVIHRDVKPHNVMVDDEDLVKILDFGVAHVAESNVTASGVLIGTPNYMAPEQVTGGQIDRRTDVFAVGSVFYELLSYQRAFTGDLITSVHRIVYEEPAPLARLVPSLDPRLIRIVERALAKDPDRRYSTLRSMAAEINAARQSLDGTLAAPTEIAPSPPAAGRTPAAVVGSPTTLQLSATARAAAASRQRRLWRVAAPLVTLAAAAGVYALVTFRPATPVVPAETPAPAASAAVPEPPTTPAQEAATATMQPLSSAEAGRQAAPPAPALLTSAPAAPARPTPTGAAPATSPTAAPGPLATSAPPPPTPSPPSPVPASAPPPSVPVRDIASAADQLPVSTRPAPPEEAPRPAPAPAPPAAAPAAAAAPVVDDRAAIEEVLNEYRRAYEARDLARVQRVFPGLPSPATVGTAFAEAREVLIGMSPPDIRVTSPTTATAACRLNQNFVPQVGTARAAPTRNVTFALRKDTGRWTIVSLR